MMPQLERAYAQMADFASATMRSYWKDFVVCDRAFLEDWPADATCFWWTVYSQGTDIGHDRNLFHLRLSYFSIALFGSNPGARCFKWTEADGLVEMTREAALADITATCFARYPNAGAPADYWRGTSKWQPRHDKSH